MLAVSQDPETHRQDEMNGGENKTKNKQKTREMEGLDSVDAVQLVKTKTETAFSSKTSQLRDISGERCLSTNRNEGRIPLLLSQLDILSDPTVWDVASWQKKAQWIYTTMLFQ